MQKWSLKVDRLYLDEETVSINTDEIYTAWAVNLSQLLSIVKDIDDPDNWYITRAKEGWCYYLTRVKREGKYPH